MYAWLSSKIDTLTENITTSFVFFIITLTAVAMIIFLLRGLSKRRLKSKQPPPRLTLCETLAIDRTRHLVLVRCDDKEHLLLTGGFTDIVIESDITGISITQTKEIQPTFTTPKINTDPNPAEKKACSLDEREQAQGNNAALFMNQPVKDSEITAEIEGRQEPSLFIPAQNK
ncbi:flagellar biosynthetic protein FliO [Bartonella florencae]|uniref:flagellar biosynthetic protein FliO n=1 Tax=Bartonella florencae TaxID=928210 RepID=UPI0003103AEE|nr:flagellar biosynthetic protein FliO [Bartonella florencae]